MSGSADRNRHELKYYISYPEYLVLRSRLNFLLKPDSNVNQDRSYTISSLYFDDFNDSAYCEKLDGLESRKKYRIRVYNSSDSIIKLECKSKKGSLVNKQSFTMSREEYQRALEGNPSKGILQATGLRFDFYNEMLNNYLRPKVIVEYDREAYVGDMSELRVTFDKNLRVIYNTMDLFADFSSKQFVLPYGLIVLEVKYNRVLPEYIRNILSIVDKHSSAISKYVLCREKFNELKEL